MNYNDNLRHQTEPYRHRTRRKKLWHRIVSALGCVVVFLTTYALILPAVTLDDSPICGFEEHRHDSSCYMMPDPVSQLICSATPHQHTPECADACSYADFFLHSHSNDHSESGHFVCKLPEIEAHTHDHSCYNEVVPTVCGIEESEGHAHGELCCTVTTELTCTEPELEAHTHTDTCFDEAGEPVCGIVESQGHIHSEQCFTTVSTLTCELPETEGHTHVDTCMGAAENVLVCERPEYLPHTHEDGCFDEDGAVICGCIELMEHIHSDSCLVATEVAAAPVLICEKTEHLHSDSCFPASETTSATLSTDPTLTTDVTDPTDVTVSTEVTEPTDSTEPTEVTDPTILELVEKVAVIYTDSTYTKLSTDTTVITVTGLIPADAEVRAFPATIRTTDAVLCAYDLTIYLPDGTIFEPAEGETLSVSIQAPDLSGDTYYPEVYYIPEEGDPELIDTIVTEDGVQFQTGHFSVYAVMATDTGEDIPTGDAGSYYHSTSYPYYQISPHRFRDGNRAIWPDCFLLVPVDEYGGKTWVPDSISWSAVGNHNYVVAYCAEYEVQASTTGDVMYTKYPVSQSSFSAADQEVLKQIIPNTYPFITVAEMQQLLANAGYSGTFTEAEMLLAAQLAVWHITDDVTFSYYDSKVSSTAALNPITEIGSGDGDDVDKIYDFLLNDAVSPDPGDLKVSNTLWSQNDDGSYTVTVTLNRAVLEGETLEATLSNGTTTVSKTLEPGTSQFTMVWSAGMPETGNITLSIKGSRIAFNVYLYDGGEYQNMISGQYDEVETEYEEILIRSTTNVTVVKNWVETDSSVRPEDLTIYLTINGSHVVEEGISPIVLSESNNWTYTWTDLPTSKNGTVLNYSVDEVTPPGYSGKFVTTESDGNKTITITNTQIPVELQTSLSVTKQWEDGNATHSGQAIIVHLYADGVYTGKDLTLSDANNWFVTFDGLPYYQEDGVTPIEYTIVEEKVVGYVPDYGDTTPVPYETTWEQVTSLEAGSVYRFVSNGVALSCDANGNLTATADATEDKYQWWTVAKSSSSWTLTNVATGKMVGFSSKTYVAADDGVALTFSNSRLSYKSGGFLGIGATTYYLQLAEGSAATTTSSSSASTFTVYKKTSADKVPSYNITLTNRLAPDYELPQTGGMGTKAFTFGGIALIATALMWGCTQRRKRERRAA